MGPLLLYAANVVRLLFACFVIACGVLTFTIRAGAGSVRVEARAGGVVGRGADGAERWTIDHPGMGVWTNNDPKPVPVGPVVIGARTFYAVDADLLEVDSEAGRIILRRRLPARIGALAPSNDSSKIHVTIVATSGYPSGAPDDRIEIEMALDGVSPGRGFFLGSSKDLWSARHDATRIVIYDWDTRAPLSATFRDDAIAALEKQEKVDATNPFLPAYRAYFLDLAGRGDEAARERALAADMPGACFTDLLRVSVMLEEDDARDEARRAFARGLDGLRASGVRTERLTTMLAQMLFLPPPRRAMARALETGDLARVDELVERAAALAPRVESADALFADLAAWLRAKGRADLAEKWEKRARIAATSPTGMPRVGRDIDVALPFLAGAIVASVLAALVAGVRASEKRRRAGRAASLFPAPRARDVLAVVFALAMAAGFGFFMTARVGTMGLVTAAPVSIFADADASPDVARWLAHLPASAGRDRWLEVARAERLAFEQGTRAGVSSPTDGEMREAIMTTDAGRVLTEMGGTGLHPFVASFIAIVVAYFIGAIVGRWRLLTLITAAVVPGAPNAFAPFGGVALTVIAAACFALSGGDHVLTDLASYAVGGYYGLKDLPHIAVRPSHEWAYGGFAALVLLHLVAAAVERSRERSREMRAIPVAGVHPR